NVKAKSRKRKNRRRGSSRKLCSESQKEDQPVKSMAMIHQRETVTNEMNSGTRKAHGDFKIQNQLPEYGSNTDRARYENKMSDSASNADSGFNTRPGSSLSSVYPSYGFPEVELPDDYVSSEEWMQLRIRKRFQRKKTKKESLASMLKEVKRIAEEHHEYTKTMENNIAYEKEQSGHVIENNDHRDKEKRDDPDVKGIIVKEYPTNADLGNDISKQHISEINGALHSLSHELDEHTEDNSNNTIETDRTVDGQTIEDNKQQTSNNGVVTESPKEYVLHSDHGGNNVKDNDGLSVLTAKTPSPSNGQVSKTSSPSAKTGIKRNDYLYDVSEKNASGNIGEKEPLQNDKHEGSIFELTMTDTNLVSNSPKHSPPPSDNAPALKRKGLQGDVKIHELQQTKKMSQEKEKDSRKSKKSKEASADDDNKGNKTTNDKKDETKVSSSSHAIYGGLDNGDHKKSIPLRKETIKEHDTTKDNRSQNVAEKNKGKSKVFANITKGIKDSNKKIIQKASTPKKGNDIKESPYHSKNNTSTSSNSSLRSLSVAARTALMMAKMKQTHLDAVKNHNGFLGQLSETRLGILELYTEMVENGNDTNFEKKEENEMIAEIHVDPEQAESDDIPKADESLEKTTHEVHNGNKITPAVCTRVSPRAFQGDTSTALFCFT
ncbi:hypothetical protein MAR_021534, partial [Mya arenaria]